MSRPAGAEPNHSGLEAKIANSIAPSLLDMGYELVRVLVLGTPQTPSLDAVLALLSCEEISSRLRNPKI